MLVAKRDVMHIECCASRPSNRSCKSEIVPQNSPNANQTTKEYKHTYEGTSQLVTYLSPQNKTRLESTVMSAVEKSTKNEAELVKNDLS